MLQIDINNLSKVPRKTSAASTRSIDDREESRVAGRWTKEEHYKFVEGLKKFGKNWKAVEDYVGTRTGAQVRSHAQKFFNKLEKEFGIKFDNLNLEETKAKFEETLRKLSAESGYEGSMTASVKETVIPELQLSKKLEKNLSPVPEFSVTNDTLTQNSVYSLALSQSNSPKISHFESASESRARPVRKYSEDVLSEKTPSLFDFIISKIKSCNNRIITPTLSDLVEMTSSSTRSSFDESHIMIPTPIKRTQEVQGFSHSSFRVNNRKMSEDNILSKLTQLRRPDENPVFDDCEILTKKLKVDN